MGHVRRVGGLLTAGALALCALPAFGQSEPVPRDAAPLRERALDLLPPGTRPASQRAPVQRIQATYGERLVERLRREADGSAVAAQHGAAGSEFLEVEYTVDPRLEARIRDVLQRQAVGLGHVVLMDPESGDLFAYVSTDPQRFPATRVYPTASLMKIVTAAAVLRWAPEVARRSCRSIGSPYQLVAAQLGGGGHARADGPPPALPGAHWTGSFRSALAISNNQCFAGFAVHDVGRDHLLDEIGRAGLLEPPAPHHPPGSLDPVETPLDLGSLGSGLAGSAISPLGAVRLAALLAHGERVTPNWIAEVRDAQGIALGVSGRVPPTSAWSEATATELRGLLEGVVEVGTASRAFHHVDGAPSLGAVRVAGKTGTLRGTDPPGLYQWFVGVAPADRPRIAIATLVVHQGPQRGASASDVAAASLAQVFCASDPACDRSGVEVLYARAAGRAAQVSRGLREAVESARREEVALDEALRPLGDTRLRLPRRLLREPVRGEVALRVELDPRGRVSGIAVEASDLPPDFGQFLVEEVRAWRFTPPRRAGHPVTATVRLPIPIQVE